MIQRKQTLFLFLSGFFNVVLLFVTCHTAIVNGNKLDITLVPIRTAGIGSTSGHLAAIYINFAALVLTFITVFVYNKRALQVKLCYWTIALWAILSAMITFCPFVTMGGAVMQVNINYIVCLIGLLAIITLLAAIRYIKKDIELLKSADRIR